MSFQLDLFGAAPAGEGSPAPPAGVVAVRGAMAAEEWLLARVDELAAEARREPARLGEPVRIVVPSRSLRRHVAARLVRRRNGRQRPAVAGVAVQTLFGLACEVLERAGEAAPRGALLFEALVEREARHEAALRRGLGELVDGYLAVAATVGDLLDAGLEPEHGEAVDEALATDGPLAASRAEVERGRVLARVAARTERRLRELGLGRRSTLLRQAVEALLAAPARVLPARAVLLYGFVSASGVAADLLMGLVRRRGATLLLDMPPVPGGREATGGATESAATARLAELAGWAPGATPSAPVKAAEDAPNEAGAIPVAAARLEAFTAAGAEAEAREIARRLHLLLAGGGGGASRPGSGGALDGEPRAEGVAVVARDLAPYREALRRHLGRLGVPFSGVGERGGLLPAGRRAAAVLDLVRLGPEAPADRWLDATEWMSAELRVDLRLALRALGAARLRDVAALRDRPFEDGVALPVRQGIVSIRRPPVASVEPPPDDRVEEVAAVEPPPDDDGEGRAVARARRISGRRLRHGVQAAALVHDHLRDAPGQAAASIHLEWLGALLGLLGLDREPDLPLAVAMDELRRELPGGLAIDAGELRLLAARALGEGGRCALGGEGGGVQVLTVAEARGRTFDRLFLMGLNRDVLPRPLREDPLLPDDLRQVLRRVLPDLALARDAFDDERHAFAQLLSAAPAVCLSWQVADEDGKPLAASPLVERLLPVIEVRQAPALYAAGPEPEERPMARPADEHAVLAGLHGSRLDVARVLPIAVEQVRGELGMELLGLDAAAVAAARWRVLEELDPDPRTAAGRAAAASLGPYFGFVGADRGGHQLYVTHLEALAACPWQLFLGRRLRIERPPDPLGALPGADPLRLGNLVHRTLDRIFKEALAAAGAPAAPVAVGWPAAEALDALLREVAAELLAEEGLVLPGLARALAEHARPFVDAARETDWPAPGATVEVVASEVEGELVLDLEAAGSWHEAAGLGGEARASAARRLRFRADREDLVGGRRRFTDYKTGRPLSEARDPRQRRRQLLAEIRAGKRLQSVAYLLAAGGSGALGRYLFLRPDLAAEAREVVVEAGDREAGAAFAAAVGAALGAWDAGTFFPRLVDPSGLEPSRCGFCAVAEACLRGDPGARRRLYQWASRQRPGGPEPEASQHGVPEPGGPQAGAPRLGAPQPSAVESALLAVWRLAAAEEPPGALAADGAAPDLEEREG